VFSREVSRGAVWKWRRVGAETKIHKMEYVEEGVRGRGACVCGDDKGVERAFHAHTYLLGPSGLCTRVAVRLVRKYL